MRAFLFVISVCVSVTAAPGLVFWNKLVVVNRVQFSSWFPLVNFVHLYRETLFHAAFGVIVSHMWLYYQKPATCFTTTHLGLFVILLKLFFYFFIIIFFWFLLIYFSAFLITDWVLLKHQSKISFTVCNMH